MMANYDEGNNHNPSRKSLLSSWRWWRSSRTIRCETISSPITDKYHDVRLIVEKRKIKRERSSDGSKKRHKSGTVRVGIHNPYVPKNLTIECSYGMNKLHSACNRNDSAKVDMILSSNKTKKKILKIVTQKDSDERTPLHYAVSNSDVSVEVVSKLIKIGGRGLILARDLYGENAVHIAISSAVSLEVISLLIDAGGRDVLFAKDNQGETTLHKCFTGEHAASVEIISKIIGLGGMELVMEKDKKGRTALHENVGNHANASIKAVLKLIEVGGRKLVMQKDKKGMTALHKHLRSVRTSVAVVSALVKAGGRDIIAEKDDSGKIALHHYIFDCSFFEGLNEDVMRILLQAGMDGEIGGELGIGGLFMVSSATEKVQQEIYDVWKEISPTVAKVVSSLEDIRETRIPILHAAIVAKAPPSVLRDIMARFDCITVKDSMNCYPIDLALEAKMKWKDGMKDIIEAMAVQQCRSNVHVAAHYGLQWKNRMKKLLISSFKKKDVTKKEQDDPMTGLSLFMLCAVGEKSNLNSIYASLQHSPQDLQV